MTQVEVIDGTGNVVCRIEVDAEKIKAAVLIDADKSDPLNRLVVAYMKAGSFGLRVTGENTGRRGDIAAVLGPLIAAVIECHTEIRYALAEDAAAAA